MQGLQLCSRENLNLMETQAVIRLGDRKGSDGLWKNEEGSGLSHCAFSYSVFLQLILWVVCCLIHYSF